MDRPLKFDPTAHGAHAVGLHEWLSRRAGCVPRQPALSCDGTCWNYAELQQRIERISAVLAEGGVAAGARVGYLGSQELQARVADFRDRHVYPEENVYCEELHKSGQPYRRPEVLQTCSRCARPTRWTAKAYDQGRCAEKGLPGHGLDHPGIRRRWH